MLNQVILTEMPSINAKYLFMAHFLKHSDSTTKSVVTRSHAYLRTDINRPCPSYPWPLFKSEAKSKAISKFQTLSLSKRGYAQNLSCDMNFTSMRIKTNFQIHDNALSLTWKQRRLATQKWSILMQMKLTLTRKVSRLASF